MKWIVSLLLILLPTVAFSADGVFTNLRATNAKFKNLSSQNITTTKFNNIVYLSKFSNLSSAKVSIGSTPTKLVLDVPYTTNTLTIPSTLQLAPEIQGVGTINIGKTLTIKSPFSAGMYQVFTGSGTVTFGAGSIDFVHPDWFAINATPGVTDMTAAFLAARKALSTTAPQGVIKLANTSYGVTSIVLSYETSLVGEGRGSHLVQIAGGEDLPVIQWDNTAAEVSYPHIVRIENVKITGLKGSSGTTNNHGIDINQYWGIDNLSLKNLWIEQCAGYGIHTNQPRSGTVANAVQFSTWDNINIQNCGSGLLLGNGFTGESQFNNMTIQHLDANAIDFTMSGVNVGAQGITFNTLTIGQCLIGMNFTASTAGLITVNEGHFEGPTVAMVKTSGAGTSNKLLINNTWFAFNAAGSTPEGIWATATGTSNIGIHSCFFQISGSGAAASWIKSTSNNTSFYLSGQNLTSGIPTAEITTTDINTVFGGFYRTSTTVGKIRCSVWTGLNAQVRGLMSETATVLPANLSGGTAIGNGTTSVAITFARAEADANYRVIPTVDFGAGTATWMPGISIGDKLTTGFTAHFSSAAPAGGYSLNWILVR